MQGRSSIFVVSLSLLACNASQPTKVGSATEQTQGAHDSNSESQAQAARSGAVAKEKDNRPLWTEEELAAAAAAVGDAPLEAGRSSLDELGSAVVEGLERKAPAELAAVLVSEEEFTGRLFLALARHPSALKLGPERAWLMHVTESNGDMKNALDNYGGQQLAFVRIEPANVRREHGLTFYEKPGLVVGLPSGQTKSIRVLGPIIEHDKTHTFKLLSYDDHP